MKTELNLFHSKTNGARARLFLMDRETGEKRLVHDWTKNLIFNSGLNLMAAGSTGFAGFFAYCQVGSGNDANEFNAAGAAVFTQTGTTLISSTPIFSSAMVGATFQYGATGTSGGTQLTISGFTDNEHVTVLQTGTVSTPTAGAVFMVNKTALTTFLYASNTYLAGSTNQASNGVCTLTRTFSFNEAASYSVNEIGYSSEPSGSSCNGRIVLGSTISVNSSNILTVEIQFTWTQSPNAPTTVANVGTNINTAGQFTLQAWSSQTINSAGVGTANTAGNLFDAPSGGSFWAPLLSAPTLNGSILPQASIALYTSAQYAGNNVVPGFSNSGQPVGVGVSNGSYSTTQTGQTVYAIIWGYNTGSQIYGSYILLFTTPVVLPNGTFAGTFQFKIQFSQTLTN